MADRNFPSDREYNFNLNPVLVAGSFQVDAVPAIAAGTIYGSGYNAVRAAGPPIVYTITTTDPYRHVISYGANLGLATPVVDMIINCGIPAGGAGAVVTMTINITPALVLAAQDPPAAGDIISFWMLLSNSAQDTIR
jgi:hypothetical protein